MGCSCVQSYEAAGNVKFSPNQLAYIWQAAGGNMQVVGVAVAIALRESGGNSGATCVNGGPGCSCNGCIDRGLWQIDSVHGAGSSYDVMTNARTAVSLYNSQGWEPWGGAIAPVNVSPDPNTPINATQGAINNSGQQPANAQDASITQWLDPSYWFQSVDSQIADAMRGVILTILNPILQVIAGIAGITAGGTMVLIGIFLIVKDSEAGQAAVKGAETGAMLAIPELGAAEASTKYIGAKGEQTLVTQRRTRAVRAGRIQLRPGTVQTTSQRMPASTRDQLRNEANGYGRQVS